MKRFCLSQFCFLISDPTTGVGKSWTNRKFESQKLGSETRTWGEAKNDKWAERKIGNAENAEIKILFKLWQLFQ